MAAALRTRELEENPCLEVGRGVLEPEAGESDTSKGDPEADHEAADGEQDDRRSVTGEGDE